MPNRHTLSIEMECLRHTLLWFALRAETERLRRIAFVALAAHAGRTGGPADRGAGEPRPPVRII